MHPRLPFVFKGVIGCAMKKWKYIDEDFLSNPSIVKLREHILETRKKSTEIEPLSADQGNVDPFLLNTLLRATYLENPTIERYVQLRREYPDFLVDATIFCDVSLVFYLDEELKQFGIEPQLVATALDADQTAINELSLKLLEQLAARKTAERQGETHLASRGVVISDALLDLLIKLCFDALLRHGQDISNVQDLLVLARERLGGSGSNYKEEMTKNQKAFQTKMYISECMALGQEPTLRQIAEVFSVSASTVLRWFPEEDMFEASKQLAIFRGETAIWEYRKDKLLR